MKVISETRCTH